MRDGSLPAYAGFCNIMARLVEWTSAGRPSSAATRKAAPPLNNDMIADALREYADLARILEDPAIILAIAAERSGQALQPSKDPYLDCPACAELSPDKVTLLNGAWSYAAPHVFMLQQMLLCVDLLLSVSSPLSYMLLTILALQVPRFLGTTTSG